MALTSWLLSVRCASTQNIATLSGLLTLDGLTVAAGDRVLVKDQTTGSQNGVYVAAAGAWTRATDFPTGTASVTPEVAVRVSDGVVNQHSEWFLVTTGSINVGTTALVFQRLLAPTSWALAVRCASTSNIVSLSGLLVIDGVTVVAGNRVLVKDQATPSQNGIYVASAGTWARATDFSQGTFSVVAELKVRIAEGASQQHTEWYLATSGTINVGTTALVFLRSDARFVSSLTTLESLSGAVGDCAQLTTQSSRASISGSWFRFDSAPAFARVISSAPVTRTITAVIAGTSARVTCAAHGFVTGQAVVVSGTGGLVDGQWIVTVVDSNSFSLNGSSLSSGWSGTGSASSTVVTMAAAHGLTMGGGLMVGGVPSGPTNLNGYWPVVGVNGPTSVSIPVASTGSATSGAIGDGGTTIVSSFGGQVGRWVRQVNDLELDPTWFGAIGDGVNDDTTPIAKTIAAAVAWSKNILFPPGSFKVTSEVKLNSEVSIRGSGFQKTGLVAGAAARSLLAVIGRGSAAADGPIVVSVENMSLWCSGNVDYGVYLAGGAGSKFALLRVYQAKVNGFHMAARIGNDRCVLTSCSAELCGRVFKTAGRATPSGAAPQTTVSGSAATATGSNVIIGDASTNFSSAAGVLPGDFIAVGAGTAANDTEWFQIASVGDYLAPGDGRKITVSTLTPAAQTRSGQPFQICVGNGYYEEPFNDNNIMVIDSFLTKNCAGSGLVFNGVIGSSVRAAQLDACGAFPVRIGRASGSAPTNVRISDVYVETLNPLVDAPGVIYVGAVNGLFVDTIRAGYTPVVEANAALGYAIYLNAATDAGARIHGVGDPISEVATTGIYSALARQAFRWAPVSLAIGNGAALLDVTNSMFFYANQTTPPGANITLSAAPSLSSATGDDGKQILLAFTDPPGSLTLQSESVLPNSGLILQTPTVTLRYRDTIVLMRVDGKWREISRSIA